MPRPFAEDDPVAVLASVRGAGFGHLVVSGATGLQSTPMPFLVDDGASLVRGHLARPNPIVGSLPAPAVLIVPVSDAYVSPNWYPSKAETARVVPTWNYEIVHLHGRLRTHDRGWTERLVRDLTDHHEAAMPEPWSVDDAPAAYIDKLLNAIVGVSIEVDRVEAKRKLSQNKSEADIAGAIDGLERHDHRQDADVADAMRRHDPHRASPEC